MFRGGYQLNITVVRGANTTMLPLAPAPPTAGGTLTLGQHAHHGAHGGHNRDHGDHGAHGELWPKGELLCAQANQMVIYGTHATAVSDYLDAVVCFMVELSLHIPLQSLQQIRLWKFYRPRMHWKLSQIMEQN